jgi:hypothetical protein
MASRILNGITYSSPDAALLPKETVPGTEDIFTSDINIKKALAICALGNIMPTDDVSITESARVNVLKCFHLCTSPTPISKDLKLWLLTGNWPSREVALWARLNVECASISNMHGEGGEPYADIYANACLNSFWLYGRPTGAPSSIQIQTATSRCLEYSMLALRNAALHAPIPERVICVHCSQNVLSRTSKSVTSEMRFDAWRATSPTATTSWLCKTCCEDIFFYSRLQASWIERGNVDTVLLQWRDDAEVTRSFAVAHYYHDDETDRFLEREPDTFHLLNYSANPFDFFQWDRRNTNNALVFGVELEMEPKQQDPAGQRKIITALGGNKGKNFILKSDGSLSYGVELVTMPFTLDQHRDGTGVDWKTELAKINRGIAKSGEGTNSCGMHVHINKKALSALTIGKMLVFLNCQPLAELITAVAQRPNSSFCVRDSHKGLKDGKRNSPNRYDIMNVSVRHPTCELRMFKGNLRPERVMKNLEFCHALVQYARQTSMQLLTDWTNFSRWLLQERGKYPVLVAFLIEKNTLGFRQLYSEKATEYRSKAGISPPGDI